MTQTAELTVRDYFQMLVRRRWLIAVIVVLVTAIGTAPAALESKSYASSADIQVPPSDAASQAEDAQARLQDRNRELATAVQLLESGEIRAAAIDLLGASAPEISSVRGTIVGFTEIVRVRVTAPTPEGAAAAADAIARVYVDQRREARAQTLSARASALRDRSATATARMASIEEQLLDPATPPVVIDGLQIERVELGREIVDFDERADQFEADAAAVLDGAGTRIVSPATVRQAAVAPERVKAAAIAFAIAVMIGIGTAVVVEVLQDRLTSVDALESLGPELPLLATVPHIDAPIDGPGATLPPVPNEAFRYLRTSLGFRTDEAPIRTLAVTSAVTAEGKSTVALHLARAAAAAGSRVVLVDADLRQPTIHERLGLSNERGLSSVLTGDAPFRDVALQADGSITVLTAGPPSPASTELLDRNAWGALVEELAQDADLVVVDAPPVLPVADALLVGRAVDATVVVARLGVVRRRDLRRALGRFADAGLRVAGVVANDGTAAAEYPATTSASA